MQPCSKEAIPNRPKETFTQGIERQWMTIKRRVV